MPSISHPNILRRPNILLCVFDSLAAALDVVDTEATVGTNSVHALPGIQTLNNLQQQSVVFSAAYAPCPESSPARASLFTGLDPVAHGVWTNGVALPIHELTFPQLLTPSGYTNWLVGRRQLAGVSNWTTEHSRPDEFDQFEWAHGALHRSRQNSYLNWLQDTVPEQYATIFPTQANPDSTIVPPEQFDAVASLPDELSFNYWVGLRACEFMSSSDNPFLGVVGFSVGALMGTDHAPGDDSEALNTHALRQADSALERMLTHLSEHSLAKDTVVIVTAARGNALPASAGSAGSAMHERAIKIPLMVRAPDQTPQIVDTPVSTIDIAPTILEFAGMPSRSRMQGISLLAILNGREPRRDWAMSRLRASEPNGSDKFDNQRKLNTQRTWQSALRVNNMKLIVHHGDLQSGVPVRYQLFDLNSDPLEKCDLSVNENHAVDLERMIDLMIDARCAMEDRTEPRIAKF